MEDILAQKQGSKKRGKQDMVTILPNYVIQI